MKNYKIIHIINNDKFIKPFIDLVEKYFNKEDHLFVFLYGYDNKDFSIPRTENVLDINNQYVGKKNLIALSKIINPLFKNSEKVILHGLFSVDLINYLYLHQSFLQKCHWVMWGGDLYEHVFAKKSIRHMFARHKKRKVIEKMGGLITYIKGDYELAKECYGAGGKYYECIMYPSNLYKEHSVDQKKHDVLNIQVGNSADPTNNHFEVFEKLLKHKEKEIKIIAPLSYGNQAYAKEVIKKGKMLFGKKFEPLSEFMPPEQYLELLRDVDIAIFAHKRQQGMGNIITLLGMGKKVYMRNDITPWKTLKDIGVDIFNVSTISLEPQSEKVIENNSQKIKSYFSEEKLVEQLKKIFREQDK